jgi:hypothetical protein
MFASFGTYVHASGRPSSASPGNHVEFGRTAPGDGAGGIVGFVLEASRGSTAHASPAPRRSSGGPVALTAPAAPLVTGSGREYFDMI